MSDRRVRVWIGVIAAVVGAVALLRVALRRQAAIARRRIGAPHGENPPDADRVWRRKLDGDPIDLLLLGDSIAAGLGVARRKDTLGARLATGLARALGRPVRLTTAAVVGSESSALADQLAGLREGYVPDIAIVIVGGNDVTHRIPVPLSTAHLRATVESLRALGAEVVVGTCPDLGALRPVPQPLRALGSRASAQLAAAQTVTAEAAGARAVSLRRAVGPVFNSEPDEMFGLDRFHPSALGYRRIAEAMLPVALAAVRGRGSGPLSSGPPTDREDD